MRALLDARNDLEQALVHRLFDVVAAARARDAGHAVIQDRGDRCLRILRERRHLLEIAGAKAGTSASHRLRLRMVSRVRYTYRSIAIDTPTTKIKASGYRNNPPSLKKLTLY
jgi:hypothetical protein